MKKCREWTTVACGLLLLVASCGPRPAVVSPPVTEALAAQTSPQAGCLRAACDQLLAFQRPHGGITEREGRWWQASIAVRAWLGAYAILGDRRYLDAAERTMDRFVGEQQYTGGWSAYVWESMEPSAHDSYNTADIGSITACLSIIAPYVSPEKAARYEAAHRRYVERFLPSCDLANGAFSNGWWHGTLYEFPYSTATATQALSLIALYQVSGERSYRWRAERAARFLVDNWRENGLAVLRPYDDREAKLLLATQYHELYYLLEGLLWTYPNTSDEPLRDGIRVVLMNYLWGDKGLFAALGTADEWIGIDQGPSAPKSRGMLGILCGIRDVLGPAAGLDQLIDRGLNGLCPVPLDRKDLEPVDYAFTALSLAEYLAPHVNVMGQRETGAQSK